MKGHYRKSDEEIYGSMSRNRVGIKYCTIRRNLKFYVEYQKADGFIIGRYDYMEIKEMSQKDWTVLALTDRLDTQTAPELEAKGLPLVNANPKLALDFAKLQYISSAGLRVLLLLAKKAKVAGGSVVLTGVDGMVKEVIEESGIDSFFTIYDNVEALP